MKKILAIILAVILSFSCLSVAVSAANDGLITSFAVESVAELDAKAGKGDGAAVKTEWYEIDGTYYLFVPSSIDLSNAKITFDANYDVYYGSTQIVSGETTDILNGKTEMIIGCNGNNFNLVIINESAVTSVFIETESGNLDAVHADKDYKEEGQKDRRCFK